MFTYVVHPFFRARDLRLLAILEFTRVTGGLLAKPSRSTKKKARATHGANREAHDASRQKWKKYSTKRCARTKP